MITDNYLDGRKRERVRFRLLIAVLAGLLVLSVTLGVSLGPVSVPARVVWGVAAYKIGVSAHGEWTVASENIVWLIRFPRVLLAAIVGGGLAVVGVTMQALVRNPLADPYIIGVSSGASVGAVLAIGMGALAIAGTLAISLAAFLGAVIAFLVVFALAGTDGRITPAKLILAGIGVGYIFTGITSYITITSSNRQLAGQVLSWTLGSLARASWFDLTLPSLVLVLVTVYLALQTRGLNALLVGDETAATLGINVHLFRRQLLTASALLTGVMVAVSGPIGFIGLMVPHMVRLVVRSDHRRVLPLSVFVGSIFLVWADVLARTNIARIDAPVELPVGVVTSIVGGPFFLWLMWQTRRINRHWSKP